MQSIPSAAAQILIMVIPIVGIVMGSVVVFFYLLWRHKQHTMMIEKGLVPPRNFNLPALPFLVFSTECGDFSPPGGLFSTESSLPLLIAS